MAFEFTVDPDLPLPLGIQLRGLIEYGISCGELEAGSKLPPVRQLAEKMGISPMTVSQVYKQLQQSGLLVGRAGNGTFVQANVHTPMSPTNDFEGLQTKIDELIDLAGTKGISPKDLIRLFNTRINNPSTLAPSIRVAMVGHFKESTRAYASDLRNQIPKRDMITYATLVELYENETLRQQVATSDLILTFANRKTEVAKLLQTNGTVMAISYIPSSETRLALVSLDPMKTVGIISTFADFLPIMKAGVRRYAPQIGAIDATILNHEDMDRIIRSMDVIIYATGVEETVTHLPCASNAFEYRHVLHPHGIRDNVLPAIERLRASAKTQNKHRKEAV